ncbi:uncharacterized protein LOC129944794 [Eupeodes corollae]|uniref:uncharacterized protein LOC129944794 n=1 Tax=Eupeodes corollae TaxID=290404 RepID=UPI0024915DAC|nr:uncharacterized protein LOC129944794 [Eupeodes corollae]
MESSETLNTSLSAVKSIPDEDLNDLLIFSQKGSVENSNLTDFQYREVMEMTADLFRDDDEEGLTFKQKTQKYPQEFNLSFSSGTPDPSLLLNSQKSESIGLSCGTPILQDNLEESVFVHPQMKNEPLDLSVPSVQFSPAISSKLENQSNDDLDLEFSADPFSSISRPNESDIYVSEDDPYKIGPSSSRACKSSMEFLTQSYSQVSLEDEEEILNKRRNLYSTKAQKDFTQIPSSVQRLYDTIKVAYSDFAFVYSLSAQMCQEKVPMDCFVHLKIGLLLSIASLEDNPDRPPISVVAIGPEFDMASLLMEHIGSVAERFVGPDDDFKVPANEDSKHTWIHADPIVMASGGIFFVGDWGRLRASRSFRLFKIIECGQVPLEKTTVTCDLEAAIWTHWRSYKFNTKDQHLFNKFIEIFGIPLIIEDDNHEALVDFILAQSSINKPESTVDELSIGTDDMRDFLAIVSKRRVDLTEEASEILRKYFIASRMDRPDCLAQKSFTTLKLFAESFAKLSLRHDVVLIDAISAVYMAENMIQNLFGAGAYPPPEFKTHSFIGDVDEHMMKFQEWLENYISRY